MTLDDAIKHCEEIAKEQDKLCKRYDDASGYTRSGNEEIRTNEAKKCAVCAEEHRMLAWWLRDYKRLKEQEPKTGHWININKEKWNTIPVYKCSACGENAELRYWDAMSPFCPWCGACMKGGE